MPPARVLVVEDNPDNQFIYRAGLQHAGFEVLIAGDGWKGLELARSRSTDFGRLFTGLVEEALVVTTTRIAGRGFLGDRFHVLFVEDQLFFGLLFGWRGCRERREREGADDQGRRTGQESSHAHLWRELASEGLSRANCAPPDRRRARPSIFVADAIIG